MVLLVGNREIGANRNAVKVVSTVVLGDATADFHLRIDIFEFGPVGDRTKRRSKATGDSTEQKIFRRPSSLDSAKINLRSEVDSIWRGVTLRNTSSPRRPPCHDSKFVCLRHNACDLLPLPLAQIILSFVR